jgi:hypothetical protein
VCVTFLTKPAFPGRPRLLALCACLS